MAGVHDAGTDDHADVVEVVGGTGHQLAGAIADVEFRLHEEQVVEEVAANIEFDVARNADENPAGTEGKESFKQNANEKNDAVDADGVAAIRCVERN